MKGRLVSGGALAIGIVLFLAALYYINFDLAAGTIRRLGLALPLALFFSGLWHLVRTWAWSWCFPSPRTVSFRRLARVRLAAEAFSYLTLRGIAGEPLKVVLLSDRVNARDATAAVALERLAYLVGTTLIVGVGSIAALVGLELTRTWFRVFRAFAIASGVLAILTAIVISGRGTYLHAAMRRFDRVFATTLASGVVGRFVAAVERQMLELLRGNPARLVVLLTATVLAYLCMALEAWVILKASGAPNINAISALAVETFSRVASFASSFIPANLGALEASSLAAVAAVGATGGGAALALARRLRGLFWAGLGLALYPRGVRPPASSMQGTIAPPAQRPRGTLLYLPQTSAQVTAAARLAGLPLAERVIRSAARSGYDRIVVFTAGVDAGTMAVLRSVAAAVDGVVLAQTPADAGAALNDPTGDPFVTAIGGSTVVSPALLQAALTVTASPGEPADVAAGPEWRESGLLRLARADAMRLDFVAAALNMRTQRAQPLPAGEDVSFGRAALAIRVTTPSELRAAEATIRRSSYKDTDNTVACFNRRISVPISVALIRTSLTANQLSLILVAVGFYAAWLFSIGHYWTGVVAAFLSLAASILDGCDGEIARLKYQESALGCWIETVGDYSYYIAIFAGLTIGAVRQTHIEGFYWIGGLALAGTLLSFAFLIFLRTRITAGRPERLHAIASERFQAEPTLLSRLIWRLSFTATRSAMPYGIFAFALFDLLPAIVVLAAIGSNIYWVSLVVKLKALMGEEDALAA